MSIFKEIGKWVKGWRLDKAFSHNAVGEISIQEAAAKTVNFLTTVQNYINSPESSLLGAILGDNYHSLVVSANVVIDEILPNLRGLAVLPDIATKLENYRFAEDDHRNKIYHDIVTSATLIFSDGKLSISDAAIALQLLQDFK